MSKLVGAFVLAVSLIGLGQPLGSRADIMPKPRLEIVGLVDDAAKSGNPQSADQVMARFQSTGVNSVTETTLWNWDKPCPDPLEITRLRVSAEAANNRGMQLIVRYFPDPSGKHLHMPLRPGDRRSFADCAYRLAMALPMVRIFEVGNEPNYKRFWRPQFSSDGQYVAPGAYFLALAATYDRLKQAEIDRHATVTVVGMELASKTRHHPLAFLAAFFEAYRQSQRNKPVMDWLSWHPYEDNNSDSPGTKHQNGTAAIGDYDLIRSTFSQAVTGTPQPPDTPLIYSELGIETVVAVNKASGYDSNCLVFQGIDPQIQGYLLKQAVTLAAQQQGVIGFVQFLGVDEPRRCGWQSGLYYSNGSRKSSLPPVREAYLWARAPDTGITNKPGVPE